MTDSVQNRETWLNDAVALALPLIQKRTGLSLGDRKVLISCGFPSGGGKLRKNGTFTSGECHHTHGTERKFFQVFIHPARHDPYEVVETTMHELLHVLLPGGVGHRKPFSQAAKKLGLEGKPTQTELGEELRERVAEMIEQLGPYPHERLESRGKTQTTRLLKVWCSDCGYIARVTLKWLEEAGAPICPQCAVSMTEGDPGDQAEMPLYAVDQTVEYCVAPEPSLIATLKAHNAKRKAAGNSPTPLPQYDPRWQLRMNRKGREVQWFVIDFGPSIDPVTNMYVFGDGTPPRHTPAESRADAIALLESLRDGSMSYKDIEFKDEAVEEADWDENAEDDRFDYEDPDDTETFDFAEDDSDPRFQWEKDRGIKAEDINPDDEQDKREAWVQS